jgi:hypothetical protein
MRQEGDIKSPRAASLSEGTLKYREMLYSLRSSDWVRLKATFEIQL